jgi:putative phage-type endonuclease
MKVIQCAQGTPEWHAARAGRVTASKVACVIAKGRGGEPSATRATYMGELIAERLTGMVGESFTNDAMKHGTETEPAARLALEVDAGLLVEEVGFVLHPRIELAGASPDGLIGDDGLLEIKCPKTHTHIEYLMRGEPPSAYLPQMAWQCACTERKWVEFVSFDPRMPKDLQLFRVRYEPSMAYLRELEDAVQTFLAELESKLAALRGIAERKAA